MTFLDTTLAGQQILDEPITETSRERLGGLWRTYSVHLRKLASDAWGTGLREELEGWASRADEAAKQASSASLDMLRNHVNGLRVYFDEQLERWDGSSPLVARVADAVSKRNERLALAAGGVALVGLAVMVARR